MFDEPVFFLLCCVTAKFGEAENSLLAYFDVLKETFHTNRTRQLTTDQIPLPFRLLCL